MIVEVRNRDLARVGFVPFEALDLTLDIKHNNVGIWKLTLPSDDSLCEHLRAPGSGLVVTEGDMTISGPTVKSTYVATKDDTLGTFTFEGTTDDIVLADMLAWPQPSNPNVSTQSVQQDTRTGPSETVMHSFVNANIGPAAPPPRRRPSFTMGVNGGRGPVVTKSVRFPMLGELLGGIALVADLGFRVVQRDTGLVFETYPVNDLTKFIRLDVRNNTLAAQRLSVAAPEVTDVIVVGKGPGVPDGSPQGTTPIRSLSSYESAESVEAEAAWGRRIERVLSQTSTDVAVELQQAADEKLAESGFTKVGVQVVPMDGESMQFGRDWKMGDRVTVVVGDGEYVSVVTGYKVRIDRTGAYLSADLGDPTDFDPNVALRSRVQQSQSRLSALERNG